jgi:hypothetical protein
MQELATALIEKSNDMLKAVNAFLQDPDDPKAKVCPTPVAIVRLWLFVCLAGWLVKPEPHKGALVVCVCVFVPAEPHKGKSPGRHRQDRFENEPAQAKGARQHQRAHSQGAIPPESAATHSLTAAPRKVKKAVDDVTAEKRKGWKPGKGKPGEDGPEPKKVGFGSGLFLPAILLSFTARRPRAQEGGFWFWPVPPRYSPLIHRTHRNRSFPLYGRGALTPALNTFVSAHSHTAPLLRPLSFLFSLRLCFSFPFDTTS